MLTNTIGDEDFTPLLSDHWEWEGPLTLAFHIDPRARWQDGKRVTAADVVFTYDAYVDPRVGSPFRTSLRWISAVTLRDSLTAIFRFRRRYPEMFYDAVYHMRILPGHLLRNLPRDQWQTAAFGRAPVGDGPYRFAAWKAGESLELVADSTFFLGRPGIPRLIWRFTRGRAISPSWLSPVRRTRSVGAAASSRVKAPHLITSARGVAYGYLGFNLAANGDWSNPILARHREIRRAAMTDRAQLQRACSRTTPRCPRGRCRSCGGSGTPRSASCRTTRLRPAGCSQHAAGSTPTRTASATAMA
jgi:ABC-type transport system substrate-binding protein